MLYILTNIRYFPLRVYSDITLLLICLIMVFNQAVHLKCLLKSFPPFLICIVFFLLIYSSLYIFNMGPLLDKCSVNIFHSMGFPFIFLRVSWWREALSFGAVQFIIFSLLLALFRNFYLIQDHEDLLLHFLPSFIVLTLTVRFAIQLELIFLMASFYFPYGYPINQT